jgi:hypothetical protein
MKELEALDGILNSIVALIESVVKMFAGSK